MATPHAGREPSARHDASLDRTHQDTTTHMTSTSATTAGRPPMGPGLFDHQRDALKNAQIAHREEEVLCDPPRGS